MTPTVKGHFIISFESYCPRTHADTHTQPTDCSNWTTKVVGRQPRVCVCDPKMSPNAGRSLHEVSMYNAFIPCQLLATHDDLLSLQLRQSRSPPLHTSQTNACRYLQRRLYWWTTTYLLVA